MRNNVVKKVLAATLACMMTCLLYTSKTQNKEKSELFVFFEYS